MVTGVRIVLDVEILEHKVDKCHHGMLGRLVRIRGLLRVWVVVMFVFGSLKDGIDFGERSSGLFLLQSCRYGE